MADPNLAAFDAAADLTKQLLTLSTGVLALAMTYVAGRPKASTSAVRKALALSAAAFLVSIAAGLFTLMALTGQIATAGTIYTPNLRFFSILQIAFFFVALVLTVRLGLLVLKTGEDMPETAPPLKVTLVDDTRDIVSAPSSALRASQTAATKPSPRPRPAASVNANTRIGKTRRKFARTKKPRHGR